MSSKNELSSQAQDFLARGDNDPASAWQVVSQGRTHFDILLYRYAAAAIADPSLRFSEEGLRVRYNDLDDQWDLGFLEAFKDLKERGYLVPSEEPQILGLFQLEPDLFNALATGLRTTLEQIGETILPVRSEWKENIPIPAFTRYATELGGFAMEYIVKRPIPQI